ncbi:HNH endonuclease [Pseudomonas nitroreducens]|uniref:HNH endonuclease n=1 Tax=Pseudomonas nitroreducens TaxID=46680 RepID=UPI0037FBF67A
MLQLGQAFNVGEMAHIIAKSEGGPRGIRGGGSDTYANLILLCPTCHRTIDKAPEGTFPEDRILQWKTEHEKAISNIGKDRKFSSIDDLKRYISPILFENNMLWQNLGPNSQAATENPSSNLQGVWELRKIDKIIPNNKIIENTIQANIHLLDGVMLEAFFQFKLHSSSFEESQYQRLDQYHLFPKKFGELFQI